MLGGRVAGAALQVGGADGVDAARGAGRELEVPHGEIEVAARAAGGILGGGEAEEAQHGSSRS